MFEILFSYFLFWGAIFLSGLRSFFFLAELTFCQNVQKRKHASCHFAEIISLRIARAAQCCVAVPARAPRYAPYDVGMTARGGVK